METYLPLLIGLVCAGLGGELFVRGSVGIATMARISPGIIGATVAAFATSSPELSVAVTSAVAGRPEIALGNTLGANIANFALILGIALLLAPMQAPRWSIARDFPIVVLIPVLFAFFLLDGGISRIEGLIMLGAFAVWLSLLIKDAVNERSAAPEVIGEMKPGRAIVESIVGLGLLLAAGYLIVLGATGVAREFGLTEFVIGATVVAIGTTTPELAVTIMSRLRGHDEVGLGTVLGSVIFNALFIVGVAASITPISVSLAAAGLALALCVLVAVMSYPSSSGEIGRMRGVMLLAVYVAYTVAILSGVTF